MSENYQKVNWNPELDSVRIDVKPNINKYIKNNIAQPKVIKSNPTSIIGFTFNPS